MTNTLKLKAATIYVPVSLWRELDQFIESTHTELNKSYGYISKHGMKSRIVVEAVREFLTARKGK